MPISEASESQDAARDTELLEWYKAGFTLRQIGAEFGITGERVRQLLKRAFGSTPVRTSVEARLEARIASGSLTQEEQRTLKYAYKKSLKLFQDDQVVSLYLAGLPMADVGKIVFGKAEAGRAYRILKQHGVTARPVGQYVRTEANKRRSYPWRRWMDNEWHTVVQHTDFSIKPVCFRALLYRKAYERRCKVTVSVNNSVVRFCFFTTHGPNSPRVRPDDIYDLLLDVEPTPNEP